MRFLVSITAGTLVAWSFGPNRWWAAILGFAILLVALDSMSRRRRLKYTFVFALAFFAFHVQWVSVLGNDAWIGLTLVCTLPWLLFALLPIDSKSNWFYLQPAAMVVVLEAIRAAWPWGGFPWGLLAFSQLDGPLVKLSTLGGQAIVSGAVVLCAAALIKLFKHRSFTAVLIVGLCLLTARSVDIKQSEEMVTLSAVQGNVPRVGNELSAQRAAVLNNHIKTTELLLSDIKSGKAPAPDLIVWPESGTDIDPLAPGIAADEINRIASLTEVPILIGATTWNGVSNKESGPTNSGILWTQAGPGQIYSKNHLVPFGEYIPMRDVLANLITRFDQIPNDFVPGDGPGVFQIGNKAIGDVICFEVAYANHIYETVAAGAQVFVVQTNNATYGNTLQPEQQFAITRFRAIETQRAFLVASTSGISGLIQQDGSVTQRTEQFESAIVTGTAPLISERTISTGYPYWVRLVSFALLVVSTRQNWKRRAS
jgi:apolipoprotein N-acyltransferase